MSILDVARKELGTSESPMGSNMGAGIRKYKASTWLNPDSPWPWCVAFWMWTVKTTFGKKFPYPTAAVEQLESYTRKHGLTTTYPQSGDAACFHGNHITLIETLYPDGSFIGLGGNQGDQVKRSTYYKGSVSTFIDTNKVMTFLGAKNPVPVRRPRYEVVRSENGHKVVVFTGTLDQAVKRVRKLFARGFWGASIVKKPPRKKT